MNESEVVRIAVRASLACIGAVVACMLALFLLAAAVSPRVNLPGIRVPHHVTSSNSGD